MKVFLKLNGWKLKYGFKTASLIFTSISLVVLTLAYLTIGSKSMPGIPVLLASIAIASIGLPLLIVGIASIKGAWHLHKAKKALTSEPFTELIEKENFSEELINEERKSQFTEVALKGEVEGFPVLARVDTQEAPEIIQLQALCEPQIIEKNQVKNLQNTLKNQDIVLDYQGVTKVISINDDRFNSGKDIGKELRKFFKVIKEEGFEPAQEELAEIQNPENTSEPQAVLI